MESRAFFVDELHGTALVPFADMLNHKYSDLEGVDAVEGVRSEDDEPQIPVASRCGRVTRQKTALLPQALLCETHGEKSMSMRMLSGVTRGSEVFNTYGEMNNAGLLLTRGFCLWNHAMGVGTPIELANVRLETILDACAACRGVRGCAAADRLDFLAASRCFARMLQDEAYEEGEDESGMTASMTEIPRYFTLSLDEDIDSRLVAVAHVLSMSAKEWADVRAQDATDPSTSIATDVSFLPPAGAALLLEALRLQASEYHATKSLDEDLARIRARAFSDTRRLHACRLRASERGVLQACASRLKKRKREMNA